MKELIDKEIIWNYIINNKIINDYFSKIKEDDFQSYIYLLIGEFIEAEHQKVSDLYINKELGKYLNGMITNQLKSSNSSYHKLYRQTNMEYNDIIYDIKDEPYEEYNIKRILTNILNNIYFYDAILYKLYIGLHPLTNEVIPTKSYREIESITKIPYTTLRKSILKTEKIIKNKLKDDRD